MPSDLVDMGQEECIRTGAKVASGELKADAATAQKTLAAKMGGLGVTVEMIEKRLKKKLHNITPDEYSELVRIGVSIHDGHSQIGEHFEQPDQPAPDDTTGEVAPEPSATDKLKAELTGSGPDLVATREGGLDVVTEEGTRSDPTPKPSTTSSPTTTSSDRPGLELALSNLMEKIVGEQPPGADAVLHNVEEAKQWFLREVFWLFGKKIADVDDASLEELHDLISNGKRIANAGLNTKANVANEAKRVAAECHLESGMLPDIAKEAGVKCETWDIFDSLKRDAMEKMLDAIRKHRDVTR